MNCAINQLITRDKNSLEFTSRSKRIWKFHLPRGKNYLQKKQTIQRLNDAHNTDWKTENDKN